MKRTPSLSLKKKSPVCGGGESGGDSDGGASGGVSFRNGWLVTLPPFPTTTNNYTPAIERILS